MTETREQRHVEVLLVEDNSADAYITREYLLENGVINRVSVAKDGVQATDFLLQRNEFAEASRPDLILLDLNLPKKDGREVLAEIKADRRLKSIPVVILTTSKSDQDLVQTYQLHANSYIVKPIDLDDFIAVIRLIEQFWFKAVRLPRWREHEERQNEDTAG